MRVIEFNRHFTEAERDEGLKDEFRTQEAMAGIFSWLVEGYFKYVRFGLKMSPAMQKVIRQYERDNDLVLQFLEERCEKTAEGSVRAKTLYDNYKIVIDKVKDNTNKSKKIEIIRYDTLKLDNKFNIILLSRFLECKDAIIKLNEYLNSKECV